MKKLFALMPLLTAFIVCSAQKKITGKYISINGQSAINSVLYINGDGSFSLEGRLEAFEFTNKGKWKIKHDTLELALEPEPPGYKVENRTDTDIVGKLIEIKPETHHSLAQFAKVFVNDTALTQTDT